MKRRTLLFAFVDVFIVFFAFLIAAYFKTGKEKAIFNYYWMPFLIFESIWIISSFLFKKYKLQKLKNKSDNLFNIIKSNLFVLFTITFVIFFASLSYSRLMIVITVVIATVIEGAISYFYLLDKEMSSGMEQVGEWEIRQEKKDKNKIGKEFPVIDDTTPKGKFYEKLKKLIVDEIGSNPFKFIKKYTRLTTDDALVISTTTKFNLTNQPKANYKYIINLKRINDIQYINKFFEAVNAKLEMGGIYINNVETYTDRKKRLLKKYPPILNWIYYFFDFLVKRVMPKLVFTKKFYFLLTGGRNRVMSRAETLGRLYSCGFELIDEKFIDQQFYFAARKIDIPVFDASPTYGPLIKLRRYGKNGKILGVYKMRTMHPFSEYLQAYVYEKSQLQEGGKFKDDFRVTSSGKLMRKFWIDELPMILNVLKGEMKIVGVRPLSEHYFNLYTDELKERRLKSKPGLIPPFYVDMPITLEEIMASEMRYLKAHEKHPLLTDINYFFKAFYNILFKKARSK
ncbi:MAG: sugar transferase [Bacteroidales bacterium]|nr:sugar transferase [Bacteroidales bacterium]